MGTRSRWSGHWVWVVGSGMGTLVLWVEWVLGSEGVGTGFRWSGYWVQVEWVPVCQGLVPCWHLSFSVCRLHNTSVLLLLPSCPFQPGDESGFAPPTCPI